MKTVLIIIALLIIFVPNCALATSGYLRSDSIKTCHNGNLYGQHGDGHWYLARVEAYQKRAGQYLINNVKHELLDIEKAKEKREKLHNFIKQSYSTLPWGSKILEIGSADGENGYAKFYFKDSVYEKFLKDLRELLSDKKTILKYKENT